MNPVFRKILFITFISAFFIIAPLVSFYAAGYKLSFSWPPRTIFQKTGTLVLDTEPAGAKIYINSELRQQFLKKYFNRGEASISTPAKIKNLLPGEYNLKLELEGYWPWEKTLTVVPGQSTFAEDIVLFKKNLPIQIFNLVPQDKNISSLPIRIIEQSPNKNYFFAANEEDLYLLDSAGKIILNAKTREMPGGGLDNIKPVWSSDGKNIIVKNFLFGALSSKLTPLSSLVGHNARNAKFNLNDSDKIYYQTQNSINQFSISSKETNILLNGSNFSDYIISDGKIFVISQIKNSTKLVIYSSKDGDVLREIEFPYSSEMDILNPGSDEIRDADKSLLNLYDPKHQILYIVDPLSTVNPLREIINNIKYINWIDGKTLLYANDFEIWLFDLNGNKKTILTRISSPITGILRHPSGNYVIFSTNKSINTIELDEREKRNITELSLLDEIYSPFLDSKGNTLYFGAKIGSQEGIYKLEIQ